MKQIQAPNPIPTKGFSIFLAGSIEMGVAENWQTRIIKEFEDWDDILFLNPRRDDWDSSWIQSIDNPQFNEQVNWELNAMELANMIVMYFDPTTKSPISLLELGLHSKSKKMIVCCPDGFWRKGNVDIVCKKYDVIMVDTIEDIILTLKEKL